MNSASVTLDTPVVRQIERALRVILSSQILSLPFTSSLTVVVIITSIRYLSKTSAAQQLPFLQTKGTETTKRRLARLGALVAASVCGLMTIMELAVVYQAAVVHPSDLEYLLKVPWPTAMTPFLAALVGTFALSYWANRTCTVYPYPRVALATLVFLVIASLISGFGCTVALFVEADYKSGVSEGFFWAFLITWSIAGLFICLPLIKSWNSERILSRHSLKPPTKIRLALRLLLSTFLLPWLVTLACISAAFASTTSDVWVSLRAGAVYMALQKILVRIIALAYVYALFDAIPEVANFSQMQAYGMEAFDFPGQAKIPRTPTSRQRFLAAGDLREVAAEAISSYEARKDTDKTEGVSILAYAYPPGKDEEAPAPVQPAVMALETDDITASRGHQSETEEVALTPAEPAQIKPKLSRRKDRTRSRVSMMVPRSCPPPLEALPRLPSAGSGSQSNGDSALSLNTASLRAPPASAGLRTKPYGPAAVTSSVSSHTPFLGPTSAPVKSTPPTLTNIGHDGKGLYLPPFTTAEHDGDIDTSSVAAWRIER